MMRGDVIDFNEIRLLSERVELSRRVHDELAEVVLSIFEAETNLRLNFPELFWGAVGFNFRTHVWEEWVKEEGLPSGDSLELMIAGLFAPNQDFVYPLPWAWEEQDVGFMPELLMDELEEDLQDMSPAYTPKGIPWAEVAALWTPVFTALAENGSLRSRQRLLPQRNNDNGRKRRTQSICGFSSFIPRLLCNSRMKIVKAVRRMSVSC
jgi:hypothetical protein